jgi:hypothetical protein
LQLYDWRSESWLTTYFHLVSLFPQLPLGSYRSKLRVVEHNCGRFAYLKEFHTTKRDTDTEHIRHIRLAGDRNNNRMERFNGELRQREKVMRTLKRPDTPILAGYQIYHNYIRPHEALDGKTPAEVAGIQVKGKDRWMTLIQNAFQNR